MACALQSTVTVVATHYKSELRPACPLMHTGETLHVDFGCLFDRGLTLEVPERVPFRLTQNVIDCFGVSGVEGTFRRAAEMTLQVCQCCIAAGCMQDA